MALKKLTGMYESKTKNGDMYLSGKTQEGVKYFVFKNNDKKSDKHPDWTLSVEEKDNNDYPEPADIPF